MGVDIVCVWKKSVLAQGTHMGLLLYFTNREHGNVAEVREGNM